MYINFIGIYRLFIEIYGNFTIPRLTLTQKYKKYNKYIKIV